MSTDVKKVICSGIDDNYLWPWMVSIYSAKFHASDTFSVKLGYIKDSLSQRNQKLIMDFCAALEINIEIKGFDFDYKVKTSNLPIQSYIRILWLDSLDEPFLWLDADTLPLENWQRIFGNLKENSSGIVLYAALDTDVIERKLEMYPKNQAYVRGCDTYFNSGIFLGFPENWKKELFNQKWPEIAARHVELGFEHHDQDVLNYLVFKHKKILSSSYNCLVMQDSLIKQRILHFTGKPKPWYFDATSQSYFSSIELLKDRNGRGAFGGANWLFEYQNYWRHENALLNFFSQNGEVYKDVKSLSKSSRKKLMARNDVLKHKLLLAIGRKWSSR